MKRKLAFTCGLLALALVAWAASTNKVDHLVVKYSLTSTNLGTAARLNATYLTNVVVSGVATNGDGSITVITTNLVYLGLRP